MYMKTDHKPVMILAGGTGFMGQDLIRFFHRQYSIVVLTRLNAGKKNNRYRNSILQRDQGYDVTYVYWDGKTRNPGWAHFIDGSAVIINLAGRTVNCRYHRNQRNEILSSRLDATRVLAAVIADAVQPPHVWINMMSGTIYRQNLGQSWDECGTIDSNRKANMPDNPLNSLRMLKRKLLLEKNDQTLPDANTDFSVFVCQQWEKSFFENSLPKTRQIGLRTAIVLGTDGVLVPLKALCRFGLGGQQGNGEQFFSWISSHDLCRMLEWMIRNETKQGIYNAAAPEPVTNRHLMQELRGSCPGIPMPAFVLELGAWIIGTETELFLKSRKLVSQRAMDEGFQFEYPTLTGALQAIAQEENN